MDDKKWLVMWGKKATAFAEKQLAARRVCLQRDPALEKRGYFGRVLRYVIIDGKCFNRELLYKDYARDAVQGC